MTPEENLLSDLNEVSHDLRNWAEDKLDEGCNAQEIIDLLREAVRIALRNWAEDKLDEGCNVQEIIDLLREYAARIAGRD